MTLKNSRPPRIIFALTVSLLCSAVAHAQRVSFGVIGGAALTNDFVAQTAMDLIPFRAYSTSKDYIVGPMVMVSLPGNFSVETDLLYRPMNFTTAGVLPSGILNSVSPATVITWEIPILAQYKFRESGLPVRPVLEIGPSFRVSGNLNGTSPSTRGITAGAGIEAPLWKLNVAPQLRYTRWAADSGHSEFMPSTKQDQLEVLVSFSF